MRILLFLAVLMIGGIPTFSFAQHALQTGYDLLAENKVAEARDYFADRLDGPKAGEAALALSFAELLLMNGEASVQAFLQFHELEDDAERRNAVQDALLAVGQDELDQGMYDYLEAQTENTYTRLAPMALYGLAEHYHLRGNEKKSRQFYDRIGYIKPWAIVGPFENISESGFDRDFGVLDQPGARATFTSKLGTEIGWIPVAEPGRQGWLHFSNHLNANNAIVYAQTFAKSPRDQEVVFRLGTSGSVRVWVNDREVFSEFRERDNHLDTYTFAAPLQRGNNRILLQIGSSGNTGTNFMLRLTDEKGELLPDLSFDNTSVPYKQGEAWTPRVIENPTQDHFDRRIADGSAHYIDFLAYAQFYWKNGFLREARQLLEQARARYPDNDHVETQLIGVLYGLDDATAASELEKQLIARSPNDAYAMRERMTELRELEDWNGFEELLTDYRQRYGESEYTVTADISLAGSQGKQERVIELIEEAADRYPTNTTFLIYEAGVASEMRKKPRQAISLLEKFLKKHYRDEAVEGLIELHMKAGNVGEVVGLFGELQERDPQSVDLLSRLSRLYYMIGDHRSSEKYLDRALELAPYKGSLHSSLAAIYAEAGETDKALKAYRTALALNPYDFDSRDAIRNLTDATGSAFAEMPETDYYELYADSKGSEAYPDDNSVVLAYDVQQVVHEGGATESRTSILIKALNPEGVDAWKEYGIPVYGNQQGTVEKVEVLDPDGSRHEASRSGTDVVFDRLQPGGAIHLVYTIKDFKYGRLSGKFWNSHLLALGLPTVQSTFSLIVPSDEKFQSTITGREHTDLQPERSDLPGERTLFVWQLRDQPGLHPEAITPDQSDVLPTVRVSNIRDWDFIAQWYSELTHAKIRVDDEVRHTVADLFADAPSDMSKREEVERIYQYVASNIRYISVPFLQSNFVPQSASKTISTQQGDCKDVSSLFVAMCEARDIKANLVLINTRNRSRNDLSLPGIGFNHCIAHVELDGKPYYVELTDENLPFGTGDHSVNGAFALLIPRRGEAFDGTVGPINPPTRGVNTVVRTGKVSFEGGDMLFDLHNSKINSVASNMRATYRNESADNRRRLMQNAIADNYPRIELTHLEFAEGLTDLSHNEVSYDYGYRVADPSTKIGDMRIYPLVLSDPLETPAYTSTPTRQQPIDLWQTFQAEYYEETLDVAAPEGQRLVEVPSSLSISNDYLEYELTYTPTDTGLRLRRSLRLKKDLVPAEDYVAFRDDVLRMVEADKINLAFE